MKAYLLPIFCLVAASLACGQYVTPTVTISPTQAQTIQAAPSPTRTAPAPTATAEPQTAIVRQPVVNVRDAANGTPTGEYIYAGQEVGILERDGDWIRIAKPAGWVFAGCLEGSKKGCIAK